MYVRKFIFMIFAGINTMAAYCQDNDKVTIEIIYNGLKPDEVYKASWFEGMTALGALQSCAKVQTNNAGKYVFVNTINDISNRKGDRAWCYMVNGRYAPKVSFRNFINAADTITWIYKKDECPLCVETKKQR